MKQMAAMTQKYKHNGKGNSTKLKTKIQLKNGNEKLNGRRD
jgi:hypothetical protein